MLKYSVLTFLLQLLCYTVILQKCKMKSSLMSSMETIWLQCLNIYPHKTKKNHWKSLLFMIQNETKFWSPAAFLRMGFLVSDCPWFWCRCETGSSADHGTEMGPKGCSTWPELSALYHSIPVPQKLHSAASLENFFLIHSSCFFLIYCWWGLFPFGFFPLFFFQGLFS